MFERAFIEKEVLYCNRRIKRFEVPEALCHADFDFTLVIELLVDA